MFSKVNESLYNRSDKSKLNIFLNVLIGLILVLLVFEIAFGATYSGIYVVKSSMRPTLIGAEEEYLSGGDYVYVNRHAEPTYGDIVVVYNGRNSTIIKRAIAFGGDYVKLDRGKLFIKYKGTNVFVEVEESYVAAENNVPTEKNSFPLVNGALDEDGYRVAEGCFFLLGDNRNVSVDSRNSGAYALSDLFGVVTEWSLKHKSFFTALHQYFTFDLPESLGIKR